MKPIPDFVSVYGSRPMGFLRVLGFLGLVLTLTPVQMVYRLTRPKQPFLIAQLFHRTLTRVLGLRVRVHGEMTAGSPVLFVCNHVSYLDIVVLSALLPASFAAKSDVAKWPMIGFLAKMQNTLFIERRATKAGEQRDVLRGEFEKGRNFIIFPEGTSTDGLTVLPFKSSLFAVVEDPLPEGQIVVQPISLGCTELDGLPITRARRPLYAWYGDMTLVKHLWSVFRLGHFTLDVIFHAAVNPKDFKDRKALAQHCHQEVARGIEQCLRGRDFALGPKNMKRLLPAV
ncbi:MAG: 1-acyl-sn-glycerol-3-phosphate acyltransferase [Pseudomonadota bacterium]|nr:1-acyl-sn-glycerol-3-phosphate acyltransferase [Pseudomonadota bacterium]